MPIWVCKLLQVRIAHMSMFCSVVFCKVQAMHNFLSLQSKYWGTFYFAISIPIYVWFSHEYVCIAIVLQVFANDDGRSRIFRCTNEQNNKNYAAIYTKIYKDLVLKAYWHAKDNNKMANNKYMFTCIYCKELVKDKNMISYHRMFNLSKSYTGDKLQNMYPTWKPSNHGHKQRIASKYKKISSPNASHFQSPSTFPLPLKLDANPRFGTPLATVHVVNPKPPPLCILVRMIA